MAQHRLIILIYLCSAGLTEATRQGAALDVARGRNDSDAAYAELCEALCRQPCEWIHMPQSPYRKD